MIVEKSFDEGTIVLNEWGSFSRLGDYMTAAEVSDKTPFSIHCDGVGTFGVPQILGTGNRHELTFRDEEQTLEIVIRLDYDPETKILQRRDSVRNLLDKPRMLRRYLARFPFARGEYEYYSQRAFWCRESEGKWTPLWAGKAELCSREGRYCEGAAPFAVLRDRCSSHALGFSVLPAGDWLIRFSSCSANGMFPDLIAEFGLNDDRLELEVAPGECWKAPEVLVQLLPDRSAFSGCAMMDRFLNRRFPARPGHQPVVYNTWLDRMSKLELPRLERQLEAAKKCGCEVFVVDYGWYEDNKAFTRLNNWDECTDRAFFGKMRDFADKVRAAGLGFGFWVEFEFFSTRSTVVKEHPEWFFPSAHPDIVVPKSWLPEVEDMLVNTLADTISRYQAVYVKNDMNHSQGYEPSRLYRYQQGIDRVMNRLKAQLPGVTFENCSSGSLRAAAGPMMENFDMHFISDNASPLENLRIVQHSAARFAPGRIYHWYVASELHPGAESSVDPGYIIQPQAATWYRMQIEDLHFGLLSCITGMLGFSCDLASFSGENLKIIASYVEFFKAHREQILRSEAHLLTEPEDFENRRGWLALQLSDPETDTHFLYGFHCICDENSRRVFHPQSLDGKGEYSVTEIFPETRVQSVLVSGAEIAKRGVEFLFPYNQLLGFRGKLIILEKRK